MITTQGPNLFSPIQNVLDEPASRQLPGRIIIADMSGVAGVALFNSLMGWSAAVGGGERVQNLGLFTLVELPFDPYDVAGTLYRMENADLILYVLDGHADLSNGDFNWIARMRSVDATMLVILNAVEGMSKEALAEQVKLLEARLARPVLPLAVGKQAEVQNRLIPAMLKVCPDLAVPLANEIPGLRAQVARQVVFNNAARCMTVGMESNLPPDLETYTGVQLRMIREIAAIYGYKGRDRLRERLGLSVAMRWVLRSGVPRLNRIKYVEGWLSSGMVSAFITLLIGFIVILGYGGYMPRWLYRFTPYVGGGRHGTAKPGSG